MQDGKVHMHDRRGRVEPTHNDVVSHTNVQLAAKAHHQLQHLPVGLQCRADELLRLLAANPTRPTSDTGRMRVGVANRYAYHARLDYRNRLYWTVDAAGTAYVWQVGGHLPLGEKNWS
jgi:hypothetical protein